MATQKKYVSLDKLTKYNELLKAKIVADDAAALKSAKDYADSLASNYEVVGAAATAKQESINYTNEQIEALTTGTGAVKANTDAIAAIKDDTNIDSFADVVAELDKKQDTGDYATKTEAQGYANAKDGAIASAKAAGEAAQGAANVNAKAIADINNETTGILAVAKKFASEEDAKVQGNVDILAGKVGVVPEGSTVMGIITNIQENAYDDTAIVGRVNEVEKEVDTLIGADTGKSVRTIANEELAAQLIAEGAADSLDTLQEIAAWIQSHPDDASAMNKAIEALEEKVVLGTYVDGEETKEYATVKAYVEAEIAKVNEEIDSVDANVIETVKVNGAALTVTDKAVNVVVPTGALASKDAVSETDLNAELAAKLNGMTDANELKAAIDAEALRVDGILNDKVDKVTGKGLSTNDLTDTLKGNYDAAYAHSQIAHAPANAQANIIESVKVNGTALTITGKAVDIAVPTDNASLTNGAGYLVASDISNKADKATTLAGYGITDAYTNTQTDTAIANAMAQFVEVSESEINALFA